MTPRHAAAHARRRRRVWPWLVGGLVAVVAGGAGFAAAAAGARWSDERVEVLPPPVTSAAQELPVLVAGSGGEVSEAGGEYALEPFDATARDSVLATWGVDGVAGVAVGGPPDLVLADAAVPHAAGCAGCIGTTGIVLGGRRDAPANALRVLAYPRPGQVVADECGFADVDSTELPLAVVTGNPGEVELRVGADRYVVESSDDERDEWEAWLDGPAGERPLGSFVAHCVALPLPSGSDPVVVRVAATDDNEVVERGVLTLVPREGGPPVVVAPLDATLLAVDVPMVSASNTITVRTAAVGDGCSEDTGHAGDAAEAGARAPWRSGSASVDSIGPPSSPAARPYLTGVAAVAHHVVVVPEGEPTLVCIDDGEAPIALFVTPPDARRLSLAVTGIDAPPATAVEVQGTFTPLGWTPCKGAVEPELEIVLCESGGDTGAIAAAGGLLDLAVVAGGVVEVARIPLTAAPGGDAEEVYRLAVPGGGTVEVTARWTDGPTGAGDEWRFAPGS